VNDEDHSRGNGDVIGHRQLRDAIVAAVESPGGTNVIILHGGTGSGKSTMLDWVRSWVPEAALFDVRRQGEASSVSLRAGRDQPSVSALVARLVARRPDRARCRIAAYDDIDHDLAPGLIPAFVGAIVSSLDLTAVILTQKTHPTRAVYPVPVQSFSLERREATRAEFDVYLQRALARGGRGLDSMTPDLLSTLYLLQTQCADFRAIADVVDRLCARAAGRTLDEAELFRLLRDDVEPDAFRSFPGMSVSAGGRLVFRAKDKTEELCEMVLGHYDDPAEFAVVAAECLPGFDAAGFAVEAAPSYRDAVMSMCLVRSPIEIVTSLFGPRDVIREIRRRELDQAREFDAPGARVRLLVRGLGFTVSDEPAGHSLYQRAVDSARSLVGTETTPDEALRGAGLGLTQNVELLLFDLVHFWASVLFGSVSILVRTFNDDTGRRPLQAHRLTGGDLTALLRYLNRDHGDVRYALGLLLTGRRRPLPETLLSAADTFVRTRNEFVHEMRGHDRKTLVRLVHRLLEHAERVVGTAAEPYPAVVKLTEIVFDEFGRRIYSATDSDGRNVRFALTREEEGEVVISSHYFMTPSRPVTIDPILVPRSVTDAGVLFREAAGYTRSSETQRRQSSRLLEMVDLSAQTALLDVGCGDGRVTLDIAARYPDVRIHGIDVSGEMVEAARRAAQGEGRPDVTFARADVLEYAPDNPFDVVFSNSAMHWVQPAEAGYGALFRLLAPGGVLAVHQGGDQTYAGLRSCAREVVEALGLTSFFAGWSYPAYYPTRAQLEDLLAATGFVEIHVVSSESDGREHPSLVRDFAFAGLLPFLRRVPEERRELLRSEFLRHAERSQPSLYQHRLYAIARRP
jgi:trans-aconitate methyltransferase